MAPLSLKPSSLRALVGELDVAREVLAHGPRDGVPAGPGVEQFAWDRGSRAIELGEVFDVLAALRVRWGSTCLCRRCLPVPEVMRVSSSLSLGSAGVAMVRPSFRIWILRAVTGSSARPSKRVACLA